MTGIQRAVLTGRNSLIVERSAEDLRFECIKLGRFDKVEALKEILGETGCKAAETLYMGDDLIDLPAMYEVGCAVAVPAAPGEIREYCHFVTKSEGGQGAVREVVDLVLKSAGLYGKALELLMRKEDQPTRAELSSDGEEESWQ